MTSSWRYPSSIYGDTKEEIFHKTFAIDFTPTSVVMFLLAHVIWFVSADYKYVIHNFKWSGVPLIIEKDVTPNMYK